MGKISDLTLTTVANAPDLLYLVQSSTSKRITVDQFFRAASNVRLAGNVFLDAGNAQILTASGTISLTTPLTELVVDNSGGTLLLPAGSDGQLKIITLTGTDNSNFYTLPNANLNATANLRFNTSGDSALLLYTNSKWQVLTISNDEMFENSIRYFSNARVWANVGANIGYLWSNLTAATSANLTTSNVAEGANLYFSNDRVWANVGANLGYLWSNLTTSVANLTTIS